MLDILLEYDTVYHETFEAENFRGFRGFWHNCESFSYENFLSYQLFRRVYIEPPLLIKMAQGVDITCGTSRGTWPTT